MVEFEAGHGLKLLGNIDFPFALGFLGYLANSVHPMYPFPHQNARFDLKRRFSTGWTDLEIRTKIFCVGNIGYFPIVASRDIAAGNEIIVNYGKIYWTKLNKWNLNPLQKTQDIIDRDNRQRKRDNRGCDQLVNSPREKNCEYEYESDSSVKNPLTKRFYSKGDERY